ncbi:Mut7-C RNAse domain-containing protein [Halosegnis sp.]|uniref:Mut7-C RNAse domain-containing protein n=1 Tax=Halosegnis sp. TaxID=2864959 RepID=UPI0035D46D13
MSAPTPPFLVDVMCGTLATYLRFCGYDAAYALDRGLEADDALLAAARAEDRRLLTRDADLAADAGDRGFLLTAREPTAQLEELATAGLDLTLADQPSRCGVCNGELVRVPADADVPEYSRDPAETTVWRCRACGQHFWKGSHWQRVQETLSGL